jgi:bifunctional UDP-N-acetylglucosamine pyrophosphorylase/glucosamine-1-phosphate N-acetyltransferase
MTNDSLATVILAAGLGTRMKSQRAKVLHFVAGRPMIEYPVALARALGSGRVVCVLGHQSDAVRAAVETRLGAGAIEVALQLEQRGTGHAVQQAAPLLRDHSGLVLILYGDVPLLTQGTLERLIAAADERTLALITMTPDSPKGYGRIVRDTAGRFVKIVEEKDCNEALRQIREVNAGIYCVPARFLFEALEAIRPDNAQGELYLTDVAERAARELTVTTIVAPVEEVMGVNDRVDLAWADRVMRRRLCEALMRSGVTVRDPDRLYLEPGVAVGPDTELGPGVELRGRTTIGSGCRISAGAILTDVTIGDGVYVKPYCVMTESTVGRAAEIGPFSHLRPGSLLEDEVHLGNFVETKKTRLGPGAKANHLTYLGDADIGAKVNVGCGTITCNYDGYNKFRTVIEDGAFIGSDTQLVAPVTVGAGAIVAAGTTVMSDVPAEALAFTRKEQVTRPGQALRSRAAAQAKKAGTAPATSLTREPKKPKVAPRRVAKAKAKRKTKPKTKSKKLGAKRG